MEQFVHIGILFAIAAVAAITGYLIGYYCGEEEGRAKGIESVNLRRQVGAIKIRHGEMNARDTLPRQWSICDSVRRATTVIEGEQ